MVFASPCGMQLGGRSARPRLNEEDGKTVRDLTSMFVTVSGCRRCGLNWYLFVCQSVNTIKWFM